MKVVVRVQIFVGRQSLDLLSFASTGCFITIEFAIFVWVHNECDYN